MVLVFMPLLEWTRRLPFFMWLPFDVNNANNYVFGLVYLFEFCCAFYAGGSNIMANMYVFFVLICLNCCLKLFSSRVMRLGYDNDYSESWTRLPHNKITFYKEMIGFVNLHLKIDG